MHLFVNATNVHVGGGATLLRSILRTMGNYSQSKTVLLDARMPPLALEGNTLSVRRVNATIWQRIRSEWWLKRTVQASDITLCFGNLPPLFKLNGYTVVLLQNRYLIDDVCLSGFTFRVRTRIQIERLWIKWRSVNADIFVVQTDSMKRLLEQSALARNIPIQILPFLDVGTAYPRSVINSGEGLRRYDFIYVASGESHKNHRNLIKAWCLLAQQNIFPFLAITLDIVKDLGLLEWVLQQKAEYGLHLENLGTLPHDGVLTLYADAKAMIYPSTFESFGIPLVEARQANLPIIASEMDYVRDSIDPEQTFDPTSPVSIARAVERFLFAKQQSVQELLGADDFMKILLERQR